MFYVYPWHCRASLTVDNGGTYSVTMTESEIQLQDGRLYVGGVPADVDLQRAVTPVHRSLVGGFSNITINDRYAAATLVFSSSNHPVAFCRSIKHTPRKQDCLLLEAGQPANTIYGHALSLGLRVFNCVCIEQLSNSQQFVVYISSLETCDEGVLAYTSVP